MEIYITKKSDGKTVKEYINSELRLSAKMITKLKKLDDGIMLNGARVTVRARLSEGDVLTLATQKETNTSDSILPVHLPIDIIYEDEYYIIVNKAPGMPTHPSHDHRDDTLANAISYLYSSRGVDFVFRAVNRLDRDTSGLVIFAKDAISADRFSKLQQSKLVTKNYLAITDGILLGEGKIEGYIRRKDNSIMLREFSTTKEHQDAAYSLTEYRSLSSSDESSLLSLILHTGRTHQIRVHLSYLGVPLLGDSLYGSESVEHRQMLHARCISFPHPFTEKQICVEAPLPLDFINAMTKKGIKYDV